MSELLPCPFCGALAKQEIDRVVRGPNDGGRRGKTFDMFPFAAAVR